MQAVFLSYPKSGRTWVRFMLDNYLCKLFGQTTENVFDAETTLNNHCHVEWTHLTAAMVLRRHYWQMGPVQVDAAAGLPWIVLTRNFHATLRSAYYQARDRVRVFDGTPSQFVRSTQYGALKIATFYNLVEALRPSLPNLTFIAYEDLKQNPRVGFRAVLEAVGLPIDGGLIEAVLKESSAEHMRKLSVLPAYAKTPLAPTDPTRPETFKVRQPGRDTLFDTDDLAYLQQTTQAVFQHHQRPEYQHCFGPADTPVPPQPITQAG